MKMHKFSLKKLTFFYEADRDYDIAKGIPNSIVYEFPLSKENVTSLFHQAKNKQKVLDFAYAVIGTGQLGTYRERAYREGDGIYEFSTDQIHWFNLDQLGTGISQAIGFFSIFFETHDKPVVFINPTSGLHPSSQSALGRVISKNFIKKWKKNAKENFEFVFETWSSFFISASKEAFRKTGHFPERPECEECVAFYTISKDVITDTGFSDDFLGEVME